jgi:hypothetical protein
MKESLQTTGTMLAMTPILMVSVFISIFMMFVSVGISCGFMLYTAVTVAKRQKPKP